MIKGIIRIVLLSTVIFFTAQLGWSYTAPGNDPNEAKTTGLQGGLNLPGTAADCPSCRAHALAIKLWTPSAAPLSSGATSGDADTSGGSN